MTTSSGIKVFPESLTYDEGWEEKLTSCQAELISSNSYEVVLDNFV